MQEQTSQPPGGRRQMSVAVAIVLMTVGAILLFALTAGSPHWLNLQVVGVILILAGILGLALPRLARAAPRAALRRRPWAVQPSAADVAGLIRPPDAAEGDATPADDFLGSEHDPRPQYDSSRDL
jgi:hypothetical protein